MCEVQMGARYLSSSIRAYGALSSRGILTTSDAVETEFPEFMMRTFTPPSEKERIASVIRDKQGGAVLILSAPLETGIVIHVAWCYDLGIDTGSVLKEIPPE